MPSKQEVQRELQKGSAASQEAATDPKMVSDITDLLNATLEAGKALAKGEMASAAVSLGNKAATLAGLAAEGSESRNAKAGVFASKAILSSLGLINLAGVTRPNVIVATIGATFLKKVALAFDLAGGDDRKAKMIAAVCDLAGQAAATFVAGAEVVGAEAASGGAATPLAIGIAGLQTAALAAAVVNVIKVARELRQPAK
jgi:hypothetical protein